jgi:uncharacterized cupin superfamily protein
MRKPDRFKQATAAISKCHRRDTIMLDALTFSQLSAIGLGKLATKPTSIEGNQLEASKVLWTSEDSSLRVGVWECSPGRFTADRDANSETCYILSGRVTLHMEDGTAKEVKAGEMLVLPRGWTGEWTIHETTRKLYVVHAAAA